MASLKDEDVSGINLTYGVCMPGDPALKQAAHPKADMGTGSDKLAGPLVRRSSYSGPGTLWSDLGPLDKQPPPFGLSSAERFLNTNPANGSFAEGEPPGPSLQAGFPGNCISAGTAVEGRPPPGQLASLETVLSERAEGPSARERVHLRRQSSPQSLEWAHLKAPSGGVRDGPNPFASPPEPWLAVNPARMSSQSDFNPFAEARSIISPLQSSFPPANARPLPQALPAGPGPSDPNSAAPAKGTDTIPSLVPGSTCGLSSVNTLDGETPLSLHPSGLFVSHEDSGSTGRRSCEQVPEPVDERGAPPAASPHRQAELGEPVRNCTRDTARGPGTPQDADVDGTAASAPAATSNACGIPPLGEGGVAEGWEAGDGGPQDGAEGRKLKRGIFSHLAESAYPLGAAPQARAAASTLPSAPLANAHRSPAALFNPFKEFATRSFDRVSDDFGEEAIPSPLDSGIIGRGL